MALTVTGPLGPIDTVNFSTFTARPSFRPGPYVNGNDWFYIWSPSPNGSDTAETSAWSYTATPQVRKSSDKGKTWAMVYDVGSTLPLPPNCFLWDQNCNAGSCQGPPGHIYFTAGAISIPTNTLFLVDYDMAANTATVISTPYDNGANPSTPWATVFVERDPVTGKVYVVFGDHSGPAFCFTLTIWDGAAWSAPLNMTPEATAPTGNMEAQYLGNGLAPDGTLYISYCIGIVPALFGPMGSLGSYVRYFDGSSLSAAIPLNDPIGNVNAPWPYGGRINFLNGQVYVPLTKVLVPTVIGTGVWVSIPTVYSAAHPNPPTFTETDLGGQLSQIIQAGIVGGKLRIFWIEDYKRDGSAPLDAGYFSEFNGIKWGPPILFHDELANPSFPILGNLQRMHNMSQPAELGAHLMGIMVGLQYPNPPNQIITYYATEFQFNLATIPVIPPKAPPGGLPSTVSSQTNRTAAVGCVPLNLYDRCLTDEMRRAARLTPAPVRCRIPGPYRRSFPHVDPPPQAEAFYENGTLAPPLVAAGYVPVFSFRVGQGYEGVINALYQTFTGALNQGSGDLMWSLQIGRWFARNLTNIGLALGSAQKQFPLSGGYLLRSNQKITFFVRNNNAVAIPPGAGLVLCGLKGFTYPV